MGMRRTITATAISAAVLLAVSCAKERGTSTNEDARRYFEAWVAVQSKAHPEYMWEKAGSGIYILEDSQVENGEVVTDKAYVMVEYTCTDLDGNVIGTSHEDLSHKTGINYDKSYYYGPATWTNSDAALNVGVRDIISGMTIGGTRKAVVPSWLATSTRYATEEEFIANVTDGSDYIYEIKIADATDDILNYQCDEMDRYWKQNIQGLDPDSDGAAENAPYTGPDGVQYQECWDTSYTGFLFRQYFNTLETGEDGSPAMTFEKDSTILINYTGRRLDGQVFDTTIADTAKVHNIYNPAKTYAPVEVKWSNDSTAITLGESGDLINGFKSMLKHLHNEEAGTDNEGKPVEGFSAGETATAIFYSSLGYGYSGSGSAIPGYAPLRFDITVVKEEEEE